MWEVSFGNRRQSSLRPEMFWWLVLFLYRHLSFTALILFKSITECVLWDVESLLELEGSLSVDEGRCILDMVSSHVDWPLTFS